jgi:hypothetical protein
MMMFQSKVYVALALALGAQATPTVDLGTADQYVILAKTGVSTVPDSSITGSLGLSPISGTAFTGFSLTADSSKTFSTSAQVEGGLYHTDHISPTPSQLTTAIGDMQTAYTDAAGRPNADGARINLGGGILGGDFGGPTAPLTQGVYTWTSDIEIANDITFFGSDTDIFILQTTGNVNAAKTVQVVLAGGAKAENIFWQVAGKVTAGAGAHLEGIFLVKTKADFITESSLNGRILSQTAVNLQKAVIVEPNVVPHSRRLEAVALAPNPEKVELLTAENFVILAKTGVSTVPKSSVTGDVGVSPISGAALTGFSTIKDSSDTFATSSQVVGKMFAADFTSPTPSTMTTAISNMEAAYTDAAGRTIDAAFITSHTNQNGRLVFERGVYIWDIDINIFEDIEFTGSATDIFILKTSKNVVVAAGKKIILSGGALAKNIFWQVAGTVEVGAGAHLEGIFLVKTDVAFVTGSSLNGRVLSQTAVTLQSAVITQPGSTNERRLLRGSK